jgi:hypothetical protein
MNVYELVNAQRTTKEILEGKGYECNNYYAFFAIRGNGVCTFRTNLSAPYSSPFYDKFGDAVEIAETGPAENVNETFSRFLEAVHAHPSITHYMQGKWRQKLADLTEEGEALGFAMEYVEMLRATAKKLAGNALAVPRVVEEAIETLYGNNE